MFRKFYEIRKKHFCIGSFFLKVSDQDVFLRFQEKKIKYQSKITITSEVFLGSCQQSIISQKGVLQSLKVSLLGFMFD